MLLEIAIGDAYGAGFEFSGKDFIGANNNLKYVTHPNIASRNVDRLRIGLERLPLEQMHGRYTDDTQMSIAIAEVIVNRKLWTKQVLAESFVNAFKRDERTGYAGGFYQFLCNINDGQEFLDKIRPHSDKSGAAMRAGVIGVYPTVSEVIEKSTMQAAITHNTVEGIAAANAAALTAHYFIYDVGPKAGLSEFINDHVPGNWTKPWSGFVSVNGIECVMAAITAVMESEKLTQVLTRCIGFGGDVDTVAAIAMGPASCCKNIEQDIPANLIDGLEEGDYGREYLMKLDDQLMAIVNQLK